MSCKWCAYAHHLEQRTRTIIQGTRAVRSGWTETNGSANGVFGVKDLNLTFCFLARGSFKLVGINC